MAYFNIASDRLTSTVCLLVGSLGLNLEGIMDCGTLLMHARRRCHTTWYQPVMVENFDRLGYR